MPRIFTTGWVLAAVLILSGCAQSVQVEPDFPRPLIQPMPMDVGVFYSPEFREFQHYEDPENEQPWTIDIGAAQTQMFDAIFSQLFASQRELPASPSGGATLPGIDAVIEPVIKNFEFSLPEQSRTELYAVWIRYELAVYGDSGNLLGTWPVTAYAQIPKRMFGAEESMTTVTEMAIRDAGASIAVRFRDAAVWDQVKGGTHAADAGSSR